VNAESSMHDLLDLGVDGIMTDRPRLLRDVFAARGLAVTGERTRAGASSTPQADLRWR